eukprot:gene17958-17805_t
MSRQSVWATKVAALIKGNNSQAALAQIKVAPTVKDLQQLRALMTADGSLLKHRLIDEATRDQIGGLVLRGPDMPDLLCPEILADLFEASALRTPHAIALSDGVTSLTYEELNTQADR